MRTWGGRSRGMSLMGRNTTKGRRERAFSRSGSIQAWRSPHVFICAGEDVAGDAVVVDAHDRIPGEVGVFVLADEGTLGGEDLLPLAVGGGGEVGLDFEQVVVVGVGAFAPE